MRQIFCWVLLGVLCSNAYVHGIELKEQSSADIAHGNKAIKAWIECAERDERFLLYDQSSRILSLRHGRAVLRRCSVEFEKLNAMPKEKTFLLHHLRRYRPLKFLLDLDVGPYDWEERLVRSAPSEGALYFADGSIISSSARWSRPGVAIILLSEEDFRALFDSCVLGFPLVILPAGWKHHG
ncbi:MAG: hypothetical protein VX294_04940 [Candidatus Latescibacterota bacterium]|nr:hypothetical protein [Candidatus Latescibacterota bacterium]